MATAYITRFKVQAGQYTAFPTDMLRYDRCAPYDSTDAANIRYSLRRENNQDIQTIGLVCIHAGKEPNLTPARWQSFGWSIVPESVSTEKVNA